ncbi:hypothetical protein WJX84_010655 [Apatococcus fuscideae]|uniref:Uncharacterized protein n=1 Tax=Apatococcus fuscideae TaxID=2026836 RepID=A0AAW1TET1_9CHLO
MICTVTCEAPCVKYLQPCPVDTISYWYMLRDTKKGYWDAWAPEIRASASEETEAEALQSLEEVIVATHKAERQAG